jgi:hypothetical protein
LGNLANSLGLEQVLLTKNREIFLENSVRYLLDDMFRRVGFPRAPLAKVKQPGIPFRVIRKAFRLTVLPMLSQIAALAGDGESIHGIFRKRAAGTNASA